MTVIAVSSATQRQFFIDLIHRALRVGSMLSGLGPAARMVRDFDEGQTSDAKKFGFGPAQLHEN
jgi:hypothetical protein